MLKDIYSELHKIRYQYLNSLVINEYVTMLNKYLDKVENT